MNYSKIFSSELFWIGLCFFIFACHGYVYCTLTGNVKQEGFREEQIPELPHIKKEGVSPPTSTNEKCKEKYMAAFKSTGCVGEVDDVVIDWWREKTNDSLVWKNMMSRCQKAAQPKPESGGNLTKEELEDSQIKCCGAAGCKPNKCTLLTSWSTKCDTSYGENINADGFIEAISSPAPVQNIKENTEVLPSEPHPRQTPILPELIPDQPKKEAEPPILIPGHKHDDHNQEQIKTVEDIRTIIGKMKEIIKSNNKTYKSKLTPEQYKLWQKAVGALKVNKKPKKKPQPISVNVDVTDSRELHYEMPGAPGIISKGTATGQLRDLLGKMSISEEARKEMEEELGRMDGKVDGATDANVEGDDAQGSFMSKKAEQGEPAKFSELLKSSSDQYIAYNEDDYGDFEKELKKVKK